MKAILRNHFRVIKSVIYNIKHKDGYRIFFNVYVFLYLSTNIFYTSILYSYINYNLKQIFIVYVKIIFIHRDIKKNNVEKKNLWQKWISNTVFPHLNFII